MLERSIKIVYAGCMALVIGLCTLFISLEIPGLLQAATLTDNRDPIYISMTNTGANFNRIVGGVATTITAAQAGVSGTAHPITIQRNDRYIVMGGSNSRGLKVQSGLNNVHITLSSVDVRVIAPAYFIPFDIAGATVNVTLEGTNVLRANETGTNDSRAALYVPPGATLNIYGAGSLEALGGPNAAGIGGHRYEQWGTINIYGGVINARCTGADGAGIGGGGVINATTTPGGTVRIYGGRVTATGGTYNFYNTQGPSGIGSGARGYGCTVEIYGGTVVATGGLYSIGGGRSDQIGTLRIFGGSVSRPNGGATPTSIQNIYLTTATLTGSNPSTKIIKGKVNGNDFQDIPNQAQLIQGQVIYGGYDMYTNASRQLFMWLPVGTWTVELWTACGYYFGGTVTINTAGTGGSNWTNILHPRTINPSIPITGGSGAEVTINVPGGGNTVFGGGEGEVVINAGAGWSVDAVNIGGRPVTITANETQNWTPLTRAGESSPFVSAKAHYLGDTSQIVILKVKDLTQNLTGVYGITISTSEVVVVEPGSFVLFIVGDASNSQLFPATVVEQGGTVSRPAITPLRDGYTFDDWVIFVGGVEQPFNFSTPITTHTAIIAKWIADAPEPTPNEYFVWFFAGGSTNSEQFPTVSVIEGYTVTRPIHTPLRDGFIFEHWTIEGEEEPYDFNQPVTENTALVAKWIWESPPEVSVIFNVEDAVNIQYFQTIAVYEGHAVSRPDFVPLRDGYIFENWYIIVGDEEILFDFTEPLTSSIVLVAKWYEIPSSSNGNSGGGSGGGDGGGGGGNPNKGDWTTILAVSVVAVVVTNALTIAMFTLTRKKHLKQ